MGTPVHRSTPERTLGRCRKIGLYDEFEVNRAPWHAGAFVRVCASTKTGATDQSARAQHPISGTGVRRMRLMTEYAPISCGALKRLEVPAIALAPSSVGNLRRCGKPNSSLNCYPNQTLHQDPTKSFERDFSVPRDLPRHQEMAHARARPTRSCRTEPLGLANRHDAHTAETN